MISRSAPCMNNNNALLSTVSSSRNYVGMVCSRNTVAPAACAPGGWQITQQQKRLFSSSSDSGSGSGDLFYDKERGDERIYFSHEDETKLRELASKLKKNAEGRGFLGETSAEKKARGTAEHLDRNELTKILKAHGFHEHLKETLDDLMEWKHHHY